MKREKKINLQNLVSLGPQERRQCQHRSGLMEPQVPTLLPALGFWLSGVALHPSRAPPGRPRPESARNSDEQLPFTARMLAMKKHINFFSSPLPSFYTMHGVMLQHVPPGSQRCWGCTPPPRPLIPPESIPLKAGCKKPASHNILNGGESLSPLLLRCIPEGGEMLPLVPSRAPAAGEHRRGVEAIHF